MMKALPVVTVAIIFLVTGNLSASISDVAVKLLDGAVSPFQYVFIRQLLCVLILLPFWINTSVSKRQAGSIKVTLLRAHLVLVGSGFLMVALTHLPLTTANAVFYTAPLIMLPLSALILGEKMSSTKIIATLIGFTGVLIVLRPSQLHWATIFALGCAFTLALYNVLVKNLPTTQPVTVTLFWTSLMSLPVSGAFAIFFWQPISWFELMLITASALFTMGYHGCAVSAYKSSNTSQIALAEYSGLIFVTLFGITWFDEVPDWLTIVGIFLIILPIILRRQKSKPLIKPKLEFRSNSVEDPHPPVS